MRRGEFLPPPPPQRLIHGREVGAQVLLGAVLEWDRVHGVVSPTERGFLSM
jgi:hypothetical protein